MKAGSPSQRLRSVPRRPTRSVEALVAECLEAKTGDNSSRPYLAQLRSDLRRFARDVKKNVADVTGTEIDAWLRGLRHDGNPVSGRTRNNVRTSLTTLFSFAKQRGYLPKHMPTEAESVPEAKVAEDETKILTADQMQKLLALRKGMCAPIWASPSSPCLERRNLYVFNGSTSI